MLDGKADVLETSAMKVAVVCDKEGKVQMAYVSGLKQTPHFAETPTQVQKGLA